MIYNMLIIARLTAVLKTPYYRCDSSMQGSIGPRQHLYGCSCSLPVLAGRFEYIFDCKQLSRCKSPFKTPYSTLLSLPSSGTIIDHCQAKPGSLQQIVGNVLPKLQHDSSATGKLYKDKSWRVQEVEGLTKDILENLGLLQTDHYFTMAV